MNIENKIITSECNFRAKVGFLKDDMYLYHRVGEEENNIGGNCVHYYLAIQYKGKLFDINISSISQFKDVYNFDNAIQETLKAIDIQNFNCKVDNYIQEVIKQIQNEKWVTDWILSIIADYDKGNNTNYCQEGLKVKEEIKRQREIKRQEENKINKEKQEEEDKRIAEQKKIEQEARDKENFCNGFIDSLPPMRKQKIANVLNKQYRYDGVVRSRKDNTIIYLRNGYLPREKTITNCVRGKINEYGYRDGDWVETKKDIYCFENDESCYLEITKTEYDYANYILNELGLENAKLSSEIK